jgi:hypothetical protein
MNYAYSATVQPSGKDVDTRSKNVNEGAVVGERSQAVSAVSCTDGEDSRLRGGRGVASILAIVTSSNGHEDTSGNRAGGSRVDRSGARATKGHVGDSAVGAAAGLDVVGDEIDTGNDTGVGALHLVSTTIK